MNLKVFGVVGGLSAALLAGHAAAGDAPPLPVPEVVAAPVSAPGAGPAATAPAGGLHAVAEGSLIDLEIVDSLTSATAKKGDYFRVRVINPIVVDGVVVIPAGAMGVGQVTVAAPPGLGGKPGELMVLARYIEVSGVRIPLRGFNVADRGRNNSNIALAIPYGVGFLVTGGNVQLGPGSGGVAKIAQSVSLPAAPVDVVAAGPATVQPATVQPATEQPTPPTS